MGVPLGAILAPRKSRNMYTCIAGGAVLDLNPIDLMSSDLSASQNGALWRAKMDPTGQKGT